MNNAKLFSDEAANIYERAISTLLKKNMLLYFVGSLPSFLCVKLIWFVGKLKKLI